MEDARTKGFVYKLGKKIDVDNSQPCPERHPIIIMSNSQDFDDNGCFMLALIHSLLSTTKKQTNTENDLLIILD